MSEGILFAARTRPANGRRTGHTRQVLHFWHSDNVDGPFMDEPLIRVYADTSVYGGVFDEEFANASQVFFRQVRERHFRLVVSEIVRDEIAPAPAEVRDLLAEMLSFAEIVTVTPLVRELYRAYINEGIVTERSAADALHVAVASTSRCTVLASWNCKHIVHFDKIPKYNAVNTLHGVAQIAIHTPLEVIGYEEEV